jgi:hypothetical protein
MQSAMIFATFGLGFVLVLFAIVAFFKKIKGGAANLKLLGIELSGQGPLAFLVVGAVFTYSGFGWASTRVEAGQCVVAKAEVEKDRENVLDTTQRLNSEVQRLSKANTDLIATISPSALETIRTQRPELFRSQPEVSIPEDLRRRLAIPIPRTRQ